MAGLTKSLTSQARTKRKESNQRTLEEFNARSSTTQGYVEEDPSVIDWLREALPTARGILDYVISLFPFSQWIFSYNIQWLLGDLIAGEQRLDLACRPYR
jgi:hypothetical protein